jgi:hypothetical protein
VLQAVWLSNGSGGLCLRMPDTEGVSGRYEASGPLRTAGMMISKRSSSLALIVRFLASLMSVSRTDTVRGPDQVAAKSPMPSASEHPYLVQAS